MKVYKLNINKQYLTLISNKDVSEDIKFPLIDKKYFTSTSISTTTSSTIASTLRKNVSYSS